MANDVILSYLAHLPEARPTGPSPADRRRGKITNALTSNPEMGARARFCGMASKKKGSPRRPSVRHLAADGTKRLFSRQAGVRRQEDAILGKQMACERQSETQIRHPKFPLRESNLDRLTRWRLGRRYRAWARTSHHNFRLIPSCCLTRHAIDIPFSRQLGIRDVTSTARCTGLAGLVAAAIDRCRPLPPLE